ncbi:hypothetical protein [Nocardia wallacei]|uniref:hypothetical protein n=1 Tax=Nocardia wallacei TaxID=480035 RepID=UPI002457D725|nr:hypothetical protein [Nocardia wallacei]
MTDRGRTLRAWAAWTEDDYHALVADLRNGLALETAAANLGRSVTAVAKRLSYFIPPEENIPVEERELWVRDRLSRPRWDWLAVVRDWQQHRREDLWSVAHTQAAAQAWAHRTPLADLARDLGTSETAATRLLLHLGLAENRGQVIDRLGATPGAALALREQMATDREACAVWILVIDGAAGTTSPHGLGFPRDITTHANQDDAEAERDRLLRWHDRASKALPTPPEPVVWSITERTLGDHAIGTSLHGQHPPRPQAAARPTRPKHRAARHRRKK